MRISPAAAVLPFLVLSAAFWGLPALDHALKAELSMAGQNPGAPVKEPAVRAKAEAFPLPDVRLLDGDFKRAMDLDGQYILSLDPDRLLHTFRVTAGLPSDAKPLGGWEAPGCGLRGHFTGHYLSACALMYESTGDARYRERCERVVAALAECQKAMGTGYVSAFPATAFDTLEAKYGGVWAPYYTIHKIMAGLVDAHRAFGDEQALDVAKGMADYFGGRMAKLTPEQIEGVLRTYKGAPQNEFGGMSDVLHRLYLLTGRDSDLKLANLFDRAWIIDPLASGTDDLTGLHANTHLAQSIGWWMHYLDTGETHYRDAATYFWQEVARRRSYVPGDNSDGEHFFKLGVEAGALSPNTAETCNVYNILKLTRALFEAEPDAEYADFYERALFNHILGSIDPVDGMTTYFISLKPGHYKVYGTPLDSFWCCNGTGMENHAKYGDSIYFHDADKLWVNLFIASEARWGEKGVTVRQETQFPREEGTAFVLKAEKPVAFTLNLRVPGWAANGVAVSVNGERQPVQAKPGSYLALTRTWKDGDRVDYRLPMSLSVHHAEDDPKTIAVMYGPVVLAGELGREDYPASDHLPAQTLLSGAPDPRVPALVDVDADQPAKWLKRVPGKALTFSTANGAKPGDVTLSPLYAIHHQRYTVYWKCMTGGEWSAEEAANQKAENDRKAEAAQYAARMVDELLPGTEMKHDFKAKDSGQGAFQGRAWRDASRGGWFSASLAVPATGPATLACTYWGSDAGGREFDIFVNDVKIATQTLEHDAPGKFFTVEYPIPAELTAGKTAVTARFQAHPERIAGGFFAIRILRADPATH
jgi:hypothetical protein